MKKKNLENEKLSNLNNKILLVGNPNVGKSVIFSALSNIHVMSSNFAGTTVSYTSAKINIEDKEFTLIDVPGTYSLSATSEAEEVAINFVKSGAKACICVLDATNLTRNLNLAFELLNYDIPVVFALNLVDIAERKGIKISSKLLGEELGCKVIETVAVKGTGLDELKKAVLEVMDTDTSSNCQKCKSGETPKTTKEIWDKSEYISKKCTKITSETPKFIDKLGDMLVKPFPGVPIALLVMILSLVLIVFGGKALRAVVFTPITNIIINFFVNLISSFNLPTLINDILIGEYGVFVIGFEWPFGLILPYVALFYVVFTFLEDCGFLPRVAVLFDNIMRKMGVQGGSLISLMMGYGCAVPAIIGTRSATTRKERLIITSMVCFAVPCVSQSGALIGLLGEKSILLLILVFLISFLVIFTVGIITGKLLQGKVDPIIIEVPNLLIPEKKAYFKKLWVRFKGFLVEAEGPMLIAVVIAAVFVEAGLLDSFASFIEPIVSGMLGLPKEASLFLLLGVIRREMAVAPLLEMNLNSLQLLVGCVVALLYIPCASVLGVIAREFNAKVAILIAISTFTTAILLGSAVNFIGSLFI